MKASTNTPQRALNQAYRKEKVNRREIDVLKRELPLLLDRIANPAETEENHKVHFRDFLKEVWYKSADCLVAPKGYIDLVVYDGSADKNPAGVMIEAKRKVNKTEMFSAARPNVKSLHELVLYFLRERNAGNTAIKTLMITDADETFLFADREFERLFWEKKRFRNKVLAADADDGKTNSVAYEIIRNHIDELDDTLQGTVVHLHLFRHWCEDGDPDTDDHLIPLYKILSPPHLLRRPFANDSNKLDKGFYRELLHIIGLEEVGVDSKGKEKANGGKKIIRRATGANRHPASLLENTWRVATEENRFRNVKDFRSYGSDPEDRQFAVALELCLTWVNRVLFLKLLESQLVAYHGGDQAYRFLTPERLPDYDALNTLFFRVLAKPVGERKPTESKFSYVPYLNSSLFEITELEDQVIRVNSLEDNALLPLAPKSVLGTSGHAQLATSNLQPLHYLFAFLDAYDFSSEGKARIQEENKRLINASVLGLIFEKINGYRDGSFYTPGFITEYMCRETIRRAVVQKFRDDTGVFASFDSDRFDDLANYLGNKYKREERLAANQLVNGLTICDPAVGSGHFLVSALNELIATKSALGILGADAGARNVDLKAVVENDELIVTDRFDEPYEYLVRTDANGHIRADELTQTIQETIFHEKRTLIENCLFGVDLNPNSVKICRLRLWIELLKHAYYVPPGPPKGGDQRQDAALPLPPSGGRGGLETLPNIDINIKQGNSLISRFALDDDLSGALGESGLTLADYRQAVVDYHRATGKEDKDRLLHLIEEVKGNFRTHISRNDKKVKILAAARGKMQQLESMLEMGDLFGTVDKGKINKELQPLQQRVAKLEEEIAGIRNNAIYEQAFEWRFEFPAVLDDGGGFVGFDVVVGNPPYVRMEELKDVKPYLSEHYKVAADRSDLYYYFFELAINVLNNKAMLAFITNNFSKTGAGKNLRKTLLDNVNIETIVDFKDNQPFEEATTYPLISIFSKTEQLLDTFEYLEVQTTGPFHIKDVIKEERILVNQSRLSVNSWLFESIEEGNLAEKIEAKGIPLVEVMGSPTYAVKTGLNAAFVVTKKIKNELIESHPSSSQLIKPFIFGHDVSPYYVKEASSWIIYIPKNKIEINSFPAIKTHLQAFKEGLSKRATKQAYYELQQAQDKYVSVYEGDKIIYSDISDRPSFTIDTKGSYPSNTIYCLNSDSTYFLGLLNSTLLWWYFTRISPSIRGGFYRYFSQYVERLPLVRAEENPGIADKISSISTQILTLKQTDPSADTSVLEGEIDLLVYRLYGLTREEVLVVDPAFELSEEEYNAITHE